MKKIGSKILLAVLLNTFIIALALGGTSFYTLFTNNENRIIQMESQLRTSYDETIKGQVEILITELDGIINQIDKGIINKEEGYIIAADIIRSAKYGDDGYFWADDLDGNNIVLLGREDVEGASRIDLQDKTGQFIIKDLLAIAKSGGGYYNYYFPKSGSDEALPKRAYIEIYEPFKWAIGTGNYIDDIDITIEKEKELVATQFKKSITFMIIILFGSIIIAFIISFVMSKSITKPIGILTELINKTANLDIVDEPSYDYLTKYKDETGVMGKAVAELRNVLRSIVTELRDDATILNNSSSLMSEIVSSSKAGINDVSNALNEFAEGSVEQASEAQVTVEKMIHLSNEINDSVKRAEKLVENTEEVNKMNLNGVDLINELNDKFDITRKSTDELNSNVKNLSESSSEIKDIIGTIKIIAEQTNLLALNAAIEAARAGEAGRGFSVVADEIRKLAEQTSNSTIQIENIISNIISEIEITMNNMSTSKEAVVVSSEVAKKVELSFESIEKAVQSTFEQLELLIVNIRNVDDNKNEVSNAVESISAITEENASGTEEISATMELQNEMMAHIMSNSSDLSNIAGKLNEIINKFEI